MIYQKRIKYIFLLFSIFFRFLLNANIILLSHKQKSLIIMINALAAVLASVSSKRLKAFHLVIAKYDAFINVENWRNLQKKQKKQKST